MRSSRMRGRCDERLVAGFDCIARLATGSDSVAGVPAHSDHRRTSSCSKIRLLDRPRADPGAHDCETAAHNEEAEQPVLPGNAVEEKDRLPPGCGDHACYLRETGSAGVAG